MRYCADTWFLLALFGQDARSLAILDGAKHGKDWIVIPLIVYAETIKKLSQRGIPLEKVDGFFDAVESSEKIQLLYPDKLIAREAAKISLSHAVPLGDAFVASTAKLTGCDVLLSGDTDYALLVKRKYLKVQSW